MDQKSPEEWPALRELLLDPEIDDLAPVKIEVMGRTFEVEVLRMKGYVRTKATSQARGKVFCGKCREQKHKTVAFACTADGSSAIAVCHDCIRGLLDEE